MEDDPAVVRAAQIVAHVAALDDVTAHLDPNRMDDPSLNHMDDQNLSPNHQSVPIAVPNRSEYYYHN